MRDEGKPKVKMIDCIDDSIKIGVVTQVGCRIDERSITHACSGVSMYFFDCWSRRLRAARVHGESLFL